MTDFFKELFAYSHHCNQQLAAVFLRQPERIAPKTHSLFAHLLNAHQIWNNRILPLQPLFGVWDAQPVEQMSPIDAENYRHTLRILQEIDLTQTVEYTTSKGQPFSNSVRDILFHVVNHSTYHRGQIAAELRNSGLEPVTTDYIFYKRD
jgi:uncharacterized damage-inducible protein DinB